MINRLKNISEEPEERPPADDYFEVSTDCGLYYVDGQQALRISELLDRLWPRRWIDFTDIFGSRVRVLRRTIQAISESTSAQRRIEKEFRRARSHEDKEGRLPWDDDDW